jgi:hypothetical protein
VIDRIGIGSVAPGPTLIGDLMTAGEFPLEEFATAKAGGRVDSGLSFGSERAMTMKGAGYCGLWVLCVILGAIAGLLIGGLLWALGFELLGSSVALVGAGAGGILAFLGFLALGDRLEERRAGSKRGG